MTMMRRKPFLYYLLTTFPSVCCLNNSPPTHDLKLSPICSCSEIGVASLMCEEPLKYPSRKSSPFTNDTVEMIMDTLIRHNATK